MSPPLALGPAVSAASGEDNLPSGAEGVPGATLSSGPGAASESPKGASEQ